MSKYFCLHNQMSARSYFLGIAMNIFLWLMFALTCAADEELNKEKVIIPESYLNDEVFSIPGLYFEINFRHFSGYLNATTDKFLHYWFLESQRSPADDPVLLWFNGGPGCSSLGGLLAENGPFRIRPDGKTLVENPYSWNKIANVVYLETPAGVGFSYSNIPQQYVDDDLVSLENYMAIQSFFKKFPHFQKNEFFLAGESYAGIYIPTLAIRIINGDAEINLKGFAIGNGFMDHLTSTNSIPYFAYYHGIISSNKFHHLLRLCCENNEPHSCDFLYNQSPECRHMGTEFRQTYFSMHLNLYNIFDECIHASNKTRGSRYGVDYHNFHYLHPTQQQEDSSHVPCVNLWHMESYLQQEEVLKALHIPDNLPKWSECNHGFREIYKKIYPSMKKQMYTLVNSDKLRGLIYNGDADMMCTFISNDWFIDSLELELIEDRAPWMYKDQIAGFVIRYKNLDVMSIKGSGHMVPTDKPGPSLKMMSRFMSDQPY